MKEFFKHKEVKKYLILVVACFSLALAYSGFIIQGNIMTGGLGGLTIIIDSFLPEDFFISSVGFIFTILSWVLFFIGWAFKGRNFAFKTLFCTILYPLFVSVLEIFFKYVPLLPIAVDTGMQLLYSVLAGFFVGLGLGLAFKVGGSTGGVDILAVIISDKTRLSVDKAIFLIDAFIIAAGIPVLGLINVIIGLISNIIYTIIIDRVLVGGQKTIFVQIISEKIDEINEFVQTKLDIGSTYYDVIGGYKKVPHKMLEVVIYRREYAPLMDYIHQIDKNAFVISLESKEVFGEGFKSYHKENND